MRAVLLALLLANILYWTWASQSGSSTAPLAQALDPDLPTLELIPREVPATPEPPTAAPIELARIGADDVLSVDDVPPEEQNAPDPEPATASEPVEVAASAPSGASANLLAAADPARFPKRCVGVGPFVSLRQASEAAGLLNDAGRTTSQRVEEAQVWVGHWVHLPSYPSRAAAIEVVEMLREKGIKDIYIEPSGELKNTISLGLFTELSRAETRAGQVRRLAEVSPQIRNRSRDGLVYWIDVPLPAGVALELDELPRNDGQILRQQPVDCPSDTANG